ncbi:MAG TPA: hypothetical protein ENK84_04580 [Desulfobulbus sp.]|nr:hypothetical protein [Desulfobulbus sp.]
MIRKAALVTVILFGTASLACANGAVHHNSSQTTMIGSFFSVVPTGTVTNTGSATDDTTSVSGSTTGDTTPPVDAQGCSTLVTADIHNKIKRAGDITSTVKKGRNNQANAASIVVTGRSNVSGKLMNTVNTNGDLTAIVRGGRNNLANAGSISINGAVSSGKVINEVKNTGDITSAVSKGRNNQANAASVAIN